MKRIIAVIILLICMNNIKAQFLQTVNNKMKLNVAQAKKIQDTINTRLKSIGDEKGLITIESIDSEVAYLYSKRYTNLIGLYNKKIDSLMGSKGNNLDKINALVLGYRKKIKDYTRLRDSYDALNTLGGTPRFLRKFFPLRSIQQAEFFYFTDSLHKKSLKFVSDLAAQSSFDGTISLSSNVFTGIIPMKYFPLKLGLSTTVTQTKDSTANEKVAAKLPYGGLININLSYPIFYSSKEIDSNRYFTFYAPIEVKYHLDDVKDKKQFKDTYNYVEVSTSLFISADLIQQNNKQDLISVFINPKISYYYGGDIFKQKIGYNKLWLGQLNCGIKVSKQFTIGANIPLYSSQKNILNKQASSIALIFEPK